MKVDISSVFFFAFVFLVVCRRISNAAQNIIGGIIFDLLWNVTASVCVCVRVCFAHVILDTMLKIQLNAVINIGYLFQNFDCLIDTTRWYWVRKSTRDTPKKKKWCWWWPHFINIEWKFKIHQLMHVRSQWTTHNESTVK